MGTGVPVELEKIRRVVEEDLVAPPELRKAVEAALGSMGGELDDEVTWSSVWRAICKVRSRSEATRRVSMRHRVSRRVISSRSAPVPRPTSSRLVLVPRLTASRPPLLTALPQVWASKWTERAWLSRRTMGVPDRSLYMSVLLQDIVPADYAFVLHTADPLSGDRNVLCGEVVVGMGEALVGNFPGRALSFTKSSDGIDVRALPSKPRGLFAGGKGLIIARSDSNGAFAVGGGGDGQRARHSLRTGGGKRPGGPRAGGRQRAKTNGPRAGDGQRPTGRELGTGKGRSTNRCQAIRRSQRAYRDSKRAASR